MVGRGRIRMPVIVLIGRSPVSGSCSPARGLPSASFRMELAGPAQVVLRSCSGSEEEDLVRPWQVHRPSPSNQLAAKRAAKAGAFGPKPEEADYLFQL